MKDLSFYSDNVMYTIRYVDCDGVTECEVTVSNFCLKAVINELCKNSCFICQVYRDKYKDL